jgi:hypothetical protein
MLSQINVNGIYDEVKHDRSMKVSSLHMGICNEILPGIK